jgi:hypothetical protein
MVPELLDIKKENRRMFILIGLYIIILFVVFIPIGDITYFRLLENWILPLSFWFVFGVSLLLFFLALLKRNRGEMFSDKA